MGSFVLRVTVFSLLCIGAKSSPTPDAHLELTISSMVYRNRERVGKISAILSNQTTSTGELFFCDDEVFNQSAANVICGELKYDSAYIQPSIASNGTGMQTIHSVRCAGDERQLSNCSWQVGVRSQCRMDIVLKCSMKHSGSNRFQWVYIGIPCIVIAVIASSYRRARLYYMHRGQRGQCRNNPPPTATNTCPVYTTENQASCTPTPYPQPPQKNPADPTDQPGMLPPTYSQTIAEDTSSLPPPPAYGALYSAPVAPREVK
ncbi:hypothetical protein CAPTEDRAFT_222489 [Capitella teleta]|uniref:SRCR domain-containing protein n=1 Tax=Capitella teleta TaxID=283909 RepID=R7U0L4_CAPTE|nr:hypothetical protein CAPTEDRAFT_222489 [Capitella teleta]|eukprot:ELT96735.1 hypothetical protein CAPTEDRAFT_222489 [Capitella teleta]